MTKKIKEQVEETSGNTLQDFMNDMIDLGKDVNDKKLRKPTFHYGDASVTNYLLWLVLAEIMKLNDKLGGE